MNNNNENIDILESYRGLSANNDSTSVTEEVSVSSVENDCECYTDCENIKFNDIVGAKTVDNGGYFGSLLKVARVNIEDSKTRGELTESAAGEVYARALEVAMQQAIMYELSHGKTQKEIALTVSQTKYQYHKIKIENAQYDLDEYIQKGKLSLEKELNTANILKIKQDILHSRAEVDNINAQIEQIQHQNAQIDQQVEQSKHEVLHIDAQTAKTYQDVNVGKAQVKQIDSEIEHLSYQNAQISQQIIQSQHEILKVDADTHLTYQKAIESQAAVRHIDAEIMHLDHQNILLDRQATQIEHEIVLIDRKVTQVEHEITLTDRKVAQIEHEILRIDAETIHIGVQDDMLRQQIVESQHNVSKIDAETSLIGAQKLKTDKETSKLQAQINQISCQCDNETAATVSKIALNSAHAAKLECDCMNSHRVMCSQANLYNVQAQGFRDNARQKLFEVQSQAFAMIFEAADRSTIPTCFDDTALNTTFTTINNKVSGADPTVPAQECGTIPEFGS